jgi:hypothetical protein
MGNARPPAIECAPTVWHVPTAYLGNTSKGSIK